MNGILDKLYLNQPLEKNEMDSLRGCVEGQKDTADQELAAAVNFVAQHPRFLEG